MSKITKTLKEYRDSSAPRDLALASVGVLATLTSHQLGGIILIVGLAVGIHRAYKKINS